MKAEGITTLPEGFVSGAAGDMLPSTRAENISLVMYAFNELHKDAKQASAIAKEPHPYFKSKVEELWPPKKEEPPAI